VVGGGGERGGDGNPGENGLEVYGKRTKKAGKSDPQDGGSERNREKLPNTA